MGKRKSTLSPPNPLPCGCAVYGRMDLDNAIDDGYCLRVPNKDLHVKHCQIHAAAPDLLSACEGLLADDYQRAIEAIWSPGPAECKWAFELVYERNSAARAAISKAKGKT